LYNLRIHAVKQDDFAVPCGECLIFAIYARMRIFGLAYYMSKLFPSTLKSKLPPFEIRKGRVSGRPIAAPLLQKSGSAALWLDKSICVCIGEGAFGHQTENTIIVKLAGHARK
jgi:hypothetical protein